MNFGFTSAFQNETFEGDIYSGIVNLNIVQRLSIYAYQVVWDAFFVCFDFSTDIYKNLEKP